MKKPADEAPAASGPSQKTASGPSSEREARLAAALRANLRRRKAPPKATD